MLRWNIRDRIAAKGWEKANHLAMGARLTYPVARRVWLSVENGEPIDRLDSDTLEKLRVAFGLKINAWHSLLEYTPDADSPPGKPARPKPKRPAKKS